MRYVCGLVFLATVLLSQSVSQSRMISGVVVDVGGKAVESARIEHGRTRAAQLTDGDGHFEFETNAPSVVIRKVGFKSHFLRTEGAAGVRIVLEPAQPVASCTLKSVPKHTVKITKDVDYTSTATIIKTQAGKAAIVCGSGPNWSFGIPLDFLVWDSVEYTESVTGDHGGMVDARGTTKDGKYWRYRGVFGKSCSYAKVDQTTAASLDCLMGRLPGR